MIAYIITVMNILQENALLKDEIDSRIEGARPGTWNMKVNHSDAVWPKLRNTGRRSSGSSSRDRH